MNRESFIHAIRAKLLRLAEPTVTKPGEETEEQRDAFIKELLAAGEMRLAVDYAFNGGDKSQANAIASKFFKDTRKKFSWNDWMTDKKTFGAVAREMGESKRKQLAEDLKAMVPILAMSWAEEARDCAALASDIENWYEPYRPSQHEIDQSELREKRRLNRYQK